MVFDLGRAMRKKEEFESARLMDFEFRQRARAARLLARRYGLDETELAKATVLRADDEVVASVARRAGLDVATATAQLNECMALARAELIGERGDPTPNRLG